MNEIGQALKEARDSSGVSIEEASKDLDINELSLKNIEEGNIGCFKDVYELKNYLKSYAKYLGLDENKLIDEFNEYMFEYTSKIPLQEIEKRLQEDSKEKKALEKITSPYTHPAPKTKKIYYILVYLLIILLIIVAVIWAINQITM